jgi:hypothetical protein
MSGITVKQRVQSPYRALRHATLAAHDAGHEPEREPALPRHPPHAKAPDGQFNTGAVYRYTCASCGQGACETMKSLAIRGEGLNAYINTTVNYGYEAQEQ